MYQVGVHDDILLPSYVGWIPTYSLKFMIFDANIYLGLLFTSCVHQIQSQPCECVHIIMVGADDELDDMLLPADVGSDPHLSPLSSSLLVN